MSKLLSRKGIYPFLHKEFQNIGLGKKVLARGGEINKVLKEYSTKNNFEVISEERKPDICTYDFKELEFDVVVIAEVFSNR